MPRRVRVVPGKGNSLIGAVAGLVILVLMLGGPGGGLWLLAPLLVVGISLYNAFGRGLTAYEAEIEDDGPAVPRAGRFCSGCGTSVAVQDRYCRSCGTALQA